MKNIALIAALAVAGLGLSACHGDRPGHWGDHHHHRHHHDDGGYYGR